MERGYGNMSSAPFVRSTRIPDVGSGLPGSCKCPRHSLAQGPLATRPCRKGHLGCVHWLVGLGWVGEGLVSQLPPKPPIHTSHIVEWSTFYDLLLDPAALFLFWSTPQPDSDYWCLLGAIKEKGPRPSHGCSPSCSELVLDKCYTYA